MVTILENRDHIVRFAVDDTVVRRVEFIIRRCDNVSIQ